MQKQKVESAKCARFSALPECVWCTQTPSSNSYLTSGAKSPSNANQITFSKSCSSYKQTNKTLKEETRETSVQTDDLCREILKSASNAISSAEGCSSQRCIQRSSPYPSYSTHPAYKRTLGDHMSTARWKFGDHLVTTWWPLVDHLVTTCWPLGDHLVTTGGPPGDHRNHHRVNRFKHDKCRIRTVYFVKLSCYS